MPLPAGTRALNLGCGLTGLFEDERWINIDNSPNVRLSQYPWLKWVLWKTGIISSTHYHAEWNKSIVVADLSKPLKYEDDSIDYVYSSHFLEHLSQADATRTIGEIYRVLKPGGLLRLVLPNLEFGARRYVAALDANPGDAEAARIFQEWLFLSQANYRDPHLWMYDVPSLTKTLVDRGFVNVTRCEYRQGRFPDRETLDIRPDDSLHVEAEKPSH